MSIVSSKFIDWRDVFSMDRVLKSRGFVLESQKDQSDTIIKKGNWSPEETSLIYNIMDDQRLQKELFEIVVDNKVSPKSDEIKSLISLPNIELERQRYVATFDWYLGELLIREFGAFSSSFGVEVLGLQSGDTGRRAGDFDVLAVMADMTLFYIETKTKRLTQDAILKTINRGLSLHTKGSVFLTTEELTLTNMKSIFMGLHHPIRGRSNVISKMQIAGVPESEIFYWQGDVYLISTHKSPNINLKIRTVLRDMGLPNVGPLSGVDSKADYRKVGYDFEEIHFANIR